jgi:transcriptional regulator with XRE-family HTH domain
MKSVYRPEYKLMIETLRAVREGKGVTQTELSSRMGENYDQTIISKIESFERRMDLIELWDYASALGIPFLKLVKRIEAAIQKS